MDLRKIEQLLADVFESHGIARHRISWLNNRTLEIMIMKKDGSMDLDLCEAVSRDVSAVLDKEDPIKSAYELDVCSFGAERELESGEEVRGAVGSYVHVQLKDPKNGFDTIEGTLTGFQDDTLSIEYMDKNRKKTAAIDYGNVRLIRLAVRL